MKIFISWSGSHSKKLGEAIRDWLPGVLQLVTPYFTPADIEKGTRWSTDIAKELEESSVGIICITRENLHSDWINFEAGALSKRLQKSVVCPILFGITNTDLTGPLKQFQTTEFDKADFHKLIGVINNQLAESKLPPKTLDNVFEKWWPDLQSKIEEILNSVDLPVQPIRSDRELLEEILTISRANIKSSTAPISLEAIKELLIAFIDLHNQQAKEHGGYQSTLDEMKKMVRPINHIIKRVGPSNEITSLVNEFQKLSYMVRSDDDQDDVEIPF